LSPPLKKVEPNNPSLNPPLNPPLKKVEPNNLHLKYTFKSTFKKGGAK